MYEHKHMRNKLTRLPNIYKNTHHKNYICNMKLISSMES